MDNMNLLQEALSLPNTELPHLKALRIVVNSDVPPDINFLAQQSLVSIIEDYNTKVTEIGLGESCIVKPTDTTKTIRKRCKKAFRHGLKHYPMRYVYAVSGSSLASGLGEEYNPYDSPDVNIKTFTGQLGKDTRKIKKPLTLKLVDPESGLERDEDEYGIVEADSSTERVRRYYKRHPKKVRKYLKDTVKDRVARNRDRRKAVKKHGKTKMKNHDVHHPNGAQNGNWRLAKKDHGRDKVNENYSFEHITTTIQDFVGYATGQLKLNQPPYVRIIEPDTATTSLGGYNPLSKEIVVITKGRLLADILRTIAHEMAHRKQDELGYIRNIEEDGATGSPIENNANTIAGILLRQYGQRNKHIFLSEHTLLTEGGAVGHLAHPFEDADLTFADMKEMIQRGLVGGLDEEEPVTEKLDGQNITFSVIDGEIKFARNKGQVKNRGKNALDVAGIRQMFAGRGNIEKAFTSAAEDLQAAVQQLSPEQLQDMFADGAKFMSLEVILPDTQNVIPYGKSVLVMHGTVEYDESGEEIGRNNEDGKTFADAVTAIGAQQQRTYGISGPRTIAFSDAETERYQKRADELSARLDRATAEFDLDENSTLAEYRHKWWEREIIRQTERNLLDLSQDQFEGLVRRWADGDKTFGVKDIENPDTKKWFREFEKTELENKQKQMIKPIETTFLQAGADTLRRTTNTLAANNPEAAAQIKRDTLTAIQGIRDSNDPDMIAKMQREIERLESIGIDKVVPSEGVVFIYKGKPYKFTGAFAPINQLTGTFKFGKAPPKPKEPSTEEPKPTTEPTTEPKRPETSAQPKGPQQPPRVVAIFSGRFQPFHAGHYSIYQSLVERFGKDNVYIASSNKTEPIKSPFPFRDKKSIITRMFDVPEDKVVQVKNPYAPVEILDELPSDTVYVTAVSQKDADRFGGEYFTDFEDTPEGKHRGHKDRGYYIVAPEMQLDVDGKNISGTQVRAIFGDPHITDRAKKEIFTKVYGKFDQEVFDKIVKVTTKSEEAKKLTAQYGGKKKKKKTKKEPTKKKTKQAAKQQAVRVAQSVLTQRIINKQTGRKILVATALGYEKDHPARKAAERLIQRAIKSTQGKKSPKKEEVIIT